ncbi:MAG TPA: sigma-70 family RNA polymerase sigma factor [Thermoanaerobaculia bacterium]|nr:sigma-70 family RNA polymerase sigma factor [Thermoanaerobaculia bacterium]
MARFVTTQWSMVLDAAGRQPESEEALAHLCARYWQPVYAFVRGEGYDAPDAQDLTQGFFARLIEKRDFASADPARGRFRSFLLGACRHFLANERDRASAKKRGGEVQRIPIDLAVAEATLRDALADELTPEIAFERQWCRALLGSALDAVRSDYLAAGNEALFERLAPFLTLDEDGGSHADAAHDLGMSAGAVKVAVHRLRRRYRDAVRRAVADTVATEGEVDDEMHHLLATVARSGGRS